MKASARDPGDAEWEGIAIGEHTLLKAGEQLHRGRHSWRLARHQFPKDHPQREDIARGCDTVPLLLVDVCLRWGSTGILLRARVERGEGVAAPSAVRRLKRGQVGLARVGDIEVDHAGMA